MGFDFDAIRREYPLEPIVAKAVPLKRAGTNKVACCPFHADKTPSFVVYTKDNRYHCFGCGADGDVMDFVSRYERVDLADAIQRITGGSAPVFNSEDRKRRENEIEAQKADLRRQQENATLDARARWAKALPINGVGNAYLTRKDIAPYGTRREGENLLVPIYDSNGLIMSVQLIPPENGGKKLFHAGAPVSGGTLTLGNASDGPIVISEGFATGATIQAATGYLVVVGFSKNALKRTAEIARERYPDRPIIIGADTNGVDEAEDAADAVSGRVIVPDMQGAEGTDFNDQAAHYGLEDVRRLFCAEEPAKERTLRFVDAFDFEESKIPPRPWIIPGVMLEGYTHMLAAPGGSGKSLFTLQVATMLATGQRWGAWQARKQCRVMVINVEDDVDEQHRRLAAAKRVMQPDMALLRGRVMLADNPESIIVAANDPVRKSVITTPIAHELQDIIREQNIDVLIVDPFAETFEGDENSNSEVKWAMKIWRDTIAKPTGCAVYLVHHTNKYSSGMAGSTDAIRGAGAIVNSTRISSTLFPMTMTEAETLDIKPEDRNRYVRFDDAKANQTLVSNVARWFEKISVTLDNHTADHPGDEVGALKPWSPPSALAGFSVPTLHLALETISRGVEDSDGIATGELFTTNYRANSSRWVGRPVAQILGVSDDRAKVIIKIWMESGLLRETTYRDTTEGKDRKGVAVDFSKLPTDMEKAR